MNIRRQSIRALAPAFGALLLTTALTGLAFGNGQPCANKQPGGPSQPTKDNPPCDGEGSNVFVPYSGNANRVIVDLKLHGSVGREPLAFIRSSNTRMAPQNQNLGRFGRETLWTHNYQWFMRDGSAVREQLAGLSSNLGPVMVEYATLRLAFPDGRDVQFNGPGTILPPHDFLNGPPGQAIQYVAAGNTPYVIRVDGDEYELDTGDGNLFTFVRRMNSNSGGFFYRIESQTDADGNVTTYGYNNDNDTIVRRVTDASGRWLRFTYNNIGGFAQQRVSLGVSPADAAAGQWHELTVAKPNEFRFLTLYYNNDFTNDPALPVAELEFYDENDQKITGTPFGSDPVWEPGREAAMAFDGNTGSYYRYAYMRNGYVGLDLGPTVKKRVSRIRYFIPDGVVDKVARAQFFGMNDLNSNNIAIKEVRASDGRRVVYDYAVFEDPSTWFRWATLTSVTYPDATVALYDYTQVHEFTRPLLENCRDPRYAGSGSRIQYVYDPNTALGFLREERNGETGGLIASTAHDGAHRPKAVYPNGNTVSYRYNNANANITEKKDGLGRKWTFTYGLNGAGHLESETDPLGRTTTYTRTIQGNLLSVTHPDGSTTAFTRDSRERILTQTIDGPGLPAPRTTTWTRDAAGRVMRLDHPDGTFETWTYNSFGQPLTHTRRNGGVETMTYSTSGLLLTVTDAEGGMTSFTYNAVDLPATVTDALGRTTSYTYNDRGQVTGVQFADGTAQSFAYDDFGNLLESIDELGHITSRSYDEFNRLVAIADPLGRTTTYSYETPGGGCGACNVEGKPVEIVLPSGKTTRYGYDVTWRLIAETTGFGSPDAATTSFAYDDADNLTQVMDPEGSTTTHAYTVRDWRASTTDPLGRTTQWTYDAVGNVLTETRPDGGVTTHSYDAMNRRLATTDPKNQTTTFTHDAEGSLLTLTDARLKTYTWQYDLRKLQTRMTYPDASYEAWTYDAVGNRLTARTRAGQTATSTHDLRNRETAIDWSDATPDITRTFDAAGRLLSSSNGQSTTTYSYDAAGQVTGETQDLRAIAPAVPVFALTHGYDADGNRASLTYPGGAQVSYTHNARNQLATVSEDGPPPIATYTHNLDGTRASKTLENGAATAYSYDAANQLLNVNHSKNDGISPPVLLQTRAYLYNSVGNRTAMQLDGGVWDVYDFDPVDQLTQVKYSASSSSGTLPQRTVGYDWDPVGNRTQVQSIETNGPVTTDTYATANAVNQYPSVNGSPLGYDANGNLASVAGGVFDPASPSAALAYDSQNRLTSVTATPGGGGSPTLSLTQVHDSRNRVIARTINGVTTLFVWDDWDLIEERDLSGSLIRRHVHGAAIDEILMSVDANGARYHHHDALGSVTALTDETGTVVESYTYDVFGQPTVFDAAGIPQPTFQAPSSGNRFLYTGREFIAEAGLYDYRNRHYSPQLGRFLQTDPIRFSAGDVNLYRYVGNSVLVFVDPWGLDSAIVVPGSVYKENSNASNDGGETKFNLFDELAKEAHTANPNVEKDVCVVNSMKDLLKALNKFDDIVYHGHGGKDGFVTGPGNVPLDPAVLGTGKANVMCATCQGKAVQDRANSDKVSSIRPNSTKDDSAGQLMKESNSWLIKNGR